MKKYIYQLSEEEFYNFLLAYKKGVELISQEENLITFATYEPVEDLTPKAVQEVKIVPQERIFKPFTVGSFLIHRPDLIPISVNPGMAFGTGLHPTTKVCLKLIEKYFLPGWTALDVGCGSGILSIALAKLGARKVLAIDIDERAVEETKENAKRNGVSLQVKQATPADLKESYQFLVANLELPIFEKEATHIKRLFSVRGVFSGLYGGDDLEKFLKLFQDHKVVKIVKMRGWYGVVLEK